MDGVSLSIAAGSFVTLLGPSGCGKTTLLRIAAGFTAPDSGRVLLDGVDVTASAPGARGMGFVFQSYALFPTQTAAANIGFALRVAGLGRRAVEARVRDVAALVDLAPLLGRYPHELSGGQQQRVALARALAPEPRALLLDEPLSALDARIRVRLRGEIRAIVDRLGITALYVTHDQEEALAISDRIVVMRAGGIEQEGPPAAIYQRPASRYVAEFVGEARLIEAAARDGRAWAGGLAWGDAPGTLVVRPETLVLCDAGQGAPALVRAASFLGAVLRLELGLEDGVTVLADIPATPDAALPQPGETVFVRAAVPPWRLP